MRETLVFTGGYTEPITQGTGEVIQGRSRGIGCYALNEETGALRLRACTPSTPNPSFLAVDAGGAYLYCVNELKRYEGKASAAASAYRIRRDAGALELLNTQATGGEDACYAALAGARWLLAANYSGAGFCALPILPDHTLGPPACIVKRTGRSVDPLRQTEPHPHQILPAPEGAPVVYVTDLGTDCLAPYDADWERGVLRPSARPPIPALPGQGPRQGRFSASGRRLYVMTEMAAAVNVYAYEPRTGETRLLQTAPAFSGTGGGGLSGAALQMHPGGRLLFGSVRGCDRIAVFRVREDGLLELLHTVPSGGRTPRDMALTPDGRFLLAGNQDSHCLAVFRIREDTGGLERVWEEEVPSVTAVVCSRA